MRDAKPDGPGSQPSRNRLEAGVLLPAYDGQGCDSLGRGLDERSVMTAMMSNRDVREEIERRAIFFAGAYRDAPTAMARLNELVATDGATSAARRLVAEPGLLGALRGRGGLFAAKEAKLERDNAVSCARTIAGSVTRQVEAETRAAEDYRASVTAQLAADGTPIPALSDKAAMALGRVSAAANEQDRRAAYAALVADAAVKMEVEGFRKAVETRFGEEGARGLMRMILAGQPIAHASVPHEQQQVFEAVVKSYVTAREGQRETDGVALRERLAHQQTLGRGLRS